MTTQSVTRCCHLAIAAAMPLVLAVCATQPVSLPLDLGIHIAPPSLAALPAAQWDEPPMPPPPLIEFAAVPHVAQPALDAGLSGAGGEANVTPHIEPERPPHPRRSQLLAWGLMDEVGVPRRPAGAGAEGTPGPGRHTMPARPEHSVRKVPQPIMPGAIVKPAGAGAGAAPAVGVQAEPRRPRHPAVRAALPVLPSYPQPSRAAGPTIMQPPTDADLDRVRVLIARAEEVAAPFYDPQNLDAARTALRTSGGIREVDPGGSHVSLRAAEARAVAAFENSVRLAAERLRDLLQSRLDDLRAIQADLWVPVAFQEMVDAVRRAEDLYRSGDYLGAYRLALATADDMLALRDSLLDRLELLYGARVEAERCLAAVQQLDTSGWAAARMRELRSLYQQLNTLYLTGLDAFQSYRLADAEEAFGAAIEVCRTLMAVAGEAYTEQMERAAALLQAVMEELEAASELTVVTEQGDVIAPQPWSGRPVLDALRAGGARRGAILDGIERRAANDLLKARELWIDGVVAFDDRKYGQSIERFEDARRYLERYKLYTVLGIHTVQLIPERRESLWRIAGYDRWYADPFLWPRIWRRNRALIQNPDLIYPNWRLIIPAI